MNIPLKICFFLSSGNHITLTLLNQQYFSVFSLQLLTKHSRLGKYMYFFCDSLQLLLWIISWLATLGYQDICQKSKYISALLYLLCRYAKQLNSLVFSIMWCLDERHQEIAKLWLPSAFSVSEKSVLLQAVIHGGYFIPSWVYELRSLCLNIS